MSTQNLPLNNNQITTGNSKRQKCEVYSRVSGYLRPVDSWNKGKQAEFFDRKEYKV